MPVSGSFVLNLTFLISHVPQLELSALQHREMLEPQATTADLGRKLLSIAQRYHDSVFDISRVQLEIMKHETFIIDLHASGDDHRHWRLKANCIVNKSML